MARVSERATSRLRELLQAPRTIRRFRDEESGVTAVEFAILALPFFVLLFGIIECSIIFFAGQMLESSVDDVARRIRTGQLDNSLTASDFKTEMCDSAAMLFDCNKIHVDLQVAATFKDLQDPPLPDPETNTTDFSNYKFTAPCPEQIAMVTASYEWPIFTFFVSDHIYPVSAGSKNSAFKKVLLNAIAVFRTEPYPKSTGGKSC